MPTERRRPTVLVTGASGFLGSRLVRKLAETHRVVAVDRHPRGDAGFDDNPHILWHRIDIADAPSVDRVFAQTADEGGAETVIHLAAYYNFTNDNHAEYRRVNVDGTRHVVDAAIRLGARQFVFASSVAACAGSRPEGPINERTPPDAEHIYARTKAAGEALLRERRDELHSVIIRFGALFSDWCEYPPLYFLLDAWLSDRWNARALGGKGRTALPFLHVRDAVYFVLQTMARRDDLDPAEVLVASVDGAVTHRQLYDTATSYNFVEPRPPLLVPKPVATAGMWARDLTGRLIGQRPFERPWMARHIDTRLEVDTSRTRARLDWTPRARLHVLKRIRFMIENARTSRMEWVGRNLEAVAHREIGPRFQVYRLVRRLEAEIEAAFGDLLDGLGDAAGDTDVRDRIRQTALRALVHAIRTGEKSPFMTYCQALAERQHERGAEPALVVNIVRALEQACQDVVGADPEAAPLEREFRDVVGLTVELGLDRIHEVYEPKPGGF